MFKRYASDERGAVTIMVALLLPVLLGFVALVAEFGFGFAVKAENQRIADLAAFAGATAYTSAASGSATTDMNAAVARIATLNGISSSAAAASVITSPRTVGSSAVSVTVSTGRSLFLSRVINDASALQIRASAAAQIPTVSVPGCILALSGSETGVTLSGGTRITASQCAVSSNNTVTVPCGTYITARGVNYNSAAAPTVGCGGITAPAGQTVAIAKTATADPFATDANVTTATSRLSSVTSLSAPAAPIVTAVTVPTTGAVNLNLPYWADPNFQWGTSLSSCTKVYNSNVWTVTCASGGTYNIGALTVGGSLTLKVVLTGTSTATKFNFSGAYSTDGTVVWPTLSSTYNFGSTVNAKGNNTFGPGTLNANEGMTLAGTSNFSVTTFNSVKMLTVDGGGTATFAAGTYNIAGGLKTNGGSTTTFGAGTFKFGPVTSACNSANYSICHSGTTLTFGGPSTFSFSAGIYNNGGSTMSFGGTSTTNTYELGAAGGNAIYMGGGAKTTFADAAGSTFKVAGNVNVAGGGGSCLTLPAATNHDIKGYFAGAGGTKFGAGIYTVKDYVAFGINGGGNVTCNGETIGVLADNVTLVVGGTVLPSSGTCSGQAFCIGAGYGNVRITAPTSTKLAVIGPTSSGSAGATLTEGSSGSKISGAFYFPRGPVLMAGGAAIADGTGTCLQIVGSRVTLTGGTTAASACVSSGATGSGSVVLVD